MSALTPEGEAMIARMIWDTMTFEESTLVQILPRFCTVILIDSAKDRADIPDLLVKFFKDMADITELTLKTLAAKEAAADK